ncbi:MAG: hypothetical protein M0036_03555 [Desulfobacteraceae bacterium]|nr:hypothetical protein [Desulfobacteraceae bacterium]
MTLDEWIQGNDSVDESMIAQKASLILDAAMTLMATTFQMAYAREHKVRSNYKGIASLEKNATSEDLDQIIPLQNYWASDPAVVNYGDQMVGAGDDDAFALRALQEMADADFECRRTESTKDGYWKHVERLVSFSSVLYRLFTKLLPDKHCKNVDGRKLQRIDFSMSKILYSAGLATSSSVEQTIEHDKTVPGLNAEMEKVERKRETAKELYYSKPINESQYTKIADAVRSRWIEKINEGNKAWKTLKSSNESDAIPDEKNKARQAWIGKYGEDVEDVPERWTMIRYLKAKGVI